MQMIHNRMADGDASGYCHNLQCRDEARLLFLVIFKESNIATDTLYGE